MPAAKKHLGFLNSAASKDLGDAVEAFHRGLSHVGFVKDKDFKFTSLWADHDPRVLSNLADKLVESGIDVLAATGGVASAQAAVEAARKADRHIRVVFVGGFDPVQAELVDNLERPNGNATGVTTATTEFLSERLQLANKLLREREVAVLIKPDTLLGRLETQRAGGAPVLQAGTESELGAAFAEAAKKGYGVLVGADAFFTSRRKKIIALAKDRKVPAIYPFREYVNDDGLMSYGPCLANAYRQAGVYAGLFLRYPNYTIPPVLKATTELTINLKTAEALEIEVAHGLLARADHIVE